MLLMLEIDVNGGICHSIHQYVKFNNDLHNNLQFLPERIKIEKVEKLVVNLHDKKEDVIHI